MKREPNLTWEELEEGIVEYATYAYANYFNTKQHDRKHLIYVAGTVAACADILKAIGSDRLKEVSMLIDDLEVSMLIDDLEERI